MSNANIIAPDNGGLPIFVGRTIYLQRRQDLQI